MNTNQNNKQEDKDEEENDKNNENNRREDEMKGAHAKSQEIKSTVGSLDEKKFTVVEGKSQGGENTEDTVDNDERREIKLVSNAGDEKERYAEGQTEMHTEDGIQLNAEVVSGKQAEGEVVRQAEGEVIRQAEGVVKRQAEGEVEVVRQAEWEVGRQAEWEVGRQAEEEVGRQAEWEVGRQAEWEVGRQAELEVGRQAEEEVGRQAEGEVETSGGEYSETPKDGVETLKKRKGELLTSIADTSQVETSPVQEEKHEGDQIELPVDGQTEMSMDSERQKCSGREMERQLREEANNEVDIEIRELGDKKITSIKEEKEIDNVFEEKEEDDINTSVKCEQKENSQFPRKRKRESSSGLGAPNVTIIPPTKLDPEIIKQQEVINTTPRTTELENALHDALKRKEAQVDRLTGEITKLKAFISKRKQTYKRKRKDEGAPTRALSAYNIFVQDRFSQLAKENEEALKSSDTDAQLKRVPPASLVASTGNQWKELAAEEKKHYEERAREDRKRYEEQMAKYQPPDKQANRKRNKTGYNMFFSAHVLRLKQSEAGVPSERGSVARLVGNAWKQLSSEEKQFYEREADKTNGMNPVDIKEEEEDGEDKRPQMPEYPPNYPVQHGEMHMHTGIPPQMHGHAQHPAQHDPRQHAHYYPPNYAYGQPTYHGYHEQAQGQQHRHYQGRAHAHYQYPPPHGHPYDQRAMM
eukprot:CAMPEP_0194160468 /NCGR_PEP_ID=MMETSP0152-20130528/78404_1 /TAXON_ID=1049557 /ORGANISM="Thalassiothrix antarctica, Strain L6-D1" /LENGTH=695 /DNA_ID=CAMNT_0038870163 /DNA_START=327 /DNA_END=2414 /DNA_ORIENTATION=+